jgi:hypothetical protein
MMIMSKYRATVGDVKRKALRNLDKYGVLWFSTARVLHAGRR